MIAPLAEMTEREWSAQVYELARTLHWTRYHTFRSERSQPGFPDEVLVRDRVIFAELKRETGKLSPAQEDWVTKLERAGAEIYVWRPSDLQQVGEILARRAA